MDHPIHSVQFEKKKYGTYQLLAFIFAFITILTALAAMISGFQVSRLKNQVKQSTNDSINNIDSVKDLQTRIAELKGRLLESQQLLSATKNQAKSLTDKNKQLEKELKTALESPKLHPTPLPKPKVEQATPNEGKNRPTEQPPAETALPPSSSAKPVDSRQESPPNPSLDSNPTVQTDEDKIRKAEPQTNTTQPSMDSAPTDTKIPIDDDQRIEGGGKIKVGNDAAPTIPMPESDSPSSSNDSPAQV